ncbi:MAG: carbon storage regulator CsrA [Gemmatales bacterium]|nr:carbon storage regulator CsrA [Gemmatales bacterium]MDW8385860.1 carbon storage regulator CsrA [Gemmatales bacterium]
MLVLTRKIGESIIIADNIRVTVVDIRGSQVRLGFTAPESVRIQRQEICFDPPVVMPNPSQPPDPAATK